MTNLPPPQPGQELHRRVTAYACLREGLEGMLDFSNLTWESVHPTGPDGPIGRVWIIGGNAWELGALPMEYSDSEVEAFLAGYHLALRRARARGLDPDPPPSPDIPIGRPYQPEED